MRVGLTIKITRNLILISILFCGTASAWQTDAWYARHVWTGEGDPVVDGVLVTRDGKVVEVGARGDVNIPDGATIHELGNQVIIPGLVVAQTNLVGSRDVDQSLTPEVKAIDGFDFYKDRRTLLASGVTTVQITPGNNRLMAGVGAVVKLAGTDSVSRILVREESLRIDLDESARNPPTIYKPPVGPVSVDRPLEPTKAQLSKTLAGSLSGLRAIFGNATADNRYVSASPEPVVEAVSSHLNAAGIIRFTATTSAEIRGALSLAREFDLKVILVDCKGMNSFRRTLDQWNGTVQGVVLAGVAPGKITNPAVDDVENQSPPWNHVRDLMDAGIPVAIRPSTDSDLPQLMFMAGQFIQGGISASETLGMLTAAPAKILGVDDRVGALTAGKDADFVVLNNDPFQMRTGVTATYIGGHAVYEFETESSTTIIQAARVYTGTGDVLENGRLVVKNSTVRGMGPDVSAPMHAKVRDFGDAVIVPGFVDLGTNLGIGGSLNGSVGLQTKLGEALYSDDPAIDLARNRGVTTVLLGSLDTDGPTPMVVFKLGDDVRVVSDPVAIRFRIGSNPANSVASITKVLDRGKKYADSWTRYEQELAEWNAAHPDGVEPKPEAGKETDAASEDDKEKAGDEGKDDESRTGPEESADGKERPGRRGRESRRRGETQDPAPDDKDQEEDKEQGKSADEKKQGETESEEEDKDAEPEKPKVQKELEPYRALFSGDIPAFVEARRADAIQAALQVFRDKYSLRTTLVGADDLARMPELLQGQEVSVCAGPDFILEIDERPVNLPQLLANEQIPFGFQSKGTTGVSQLPAAVQYSVSEGLGVSDGLRALTAGPVEMLSSGLSFGSLEAGNDADLVVLSGPPFEHSSVVLAVMIDGTWVYEREDEK